MTKPTGLALASQQLISLLPAQVERRVLFAIAHRRVPHFVNPVAFTEKVNWRILNDRRPLLEWTCDKLAMKEHASPEVPAGLHIPQTYWSGTDVRELAAADLPEHWVLKPNHRSGFVYFGHGRPDCEQLAAITAEWLEPFEADRPYEWAYTKARPMLLAEELLGKPGDTPTDYKFYVFDGKVTLIEVHANRYQGHQLRFYEPDWTPLDALLGLELATVTPPPPNLEKMVGIAGRLGQSFDFIRVDLYDVNGAMEFGEFTVYPCGGLERFEPASFDIELGRHWTLPVL